MITEAELSEALENVLPYVVTNVVHCSDATCQEPCCWNCFGLEKACDESSIASGIFQQSSKVLKEWKEGRV